MVTMQEWIEAYARLLGTKAPGDAEIDGLLGLAGVAAHASERRAAPISCYLAARAGVDLEEAAKLARRLADELDTFAGEPAQHETRSGAE